MAKFSATFSNGETVTSNGHRAYSFAYAVISSGKIVESGFTANRANAVSGAEAKMPKALSDRDKKNPATRRYWGLVAKDAGVSLDDWIARVEVEMASKRAASTIEIVAL